MVRHLYTATLCALSLAATTLVPSAAAHTVSNPPVPAPGGASAALLDCHAALAQTDRSATFAGEMSTLPGTRRMAIRVDLLERRSASEGFRGVVAPGLAVWRRSASDVQVYRYVKQVVNLPAPATFRAVISFRWLDARGHALRQSRHRTGDCEQPDQRPLLRVGHATASAPSASGDAAYAIAVRNDGRGPAGPFNLVLTVNGSPQPAVAVVGVNAFSRLEVDTTAPACHPGSTVSVALDPSRQVSEAPGGGLTRTFACPLAAPGSSAP